MKGIVWLGLQDELALLLWVPVEQEHQVAGT
jgi:hypothetical protein